MNQFFENLVKNSRIPEPILSILAVILAAILIFTFLALSALFLVYLERKFSAHIQSRLGPMRVGPHGIFQTLADALKLLTKETLIPKGADRISFFLAPVLILLSSFLAYLVLPFDQNLIAADLNIGVIYLLSLGSLTVIALLMAGFSSNNKYTFLGGMRSAAQMISYEVPLLFSILGVLILTQSTQMSEIIAFQEKGLFLILLQPLGFLIYLTAATAEVNRTPFDLPEAESELVAGYHTEYSGMRFALFFMAEYANIFLISALAAILFLGGPAGPFLPGLVWFLLKTYALVLLIMLFRWTFPRLRIDQLMKFCWKFLVPAAFLNLIITALIVIL